MFAYEANCPACKEPFRQSHVIFCSLLADFKDSTAESYMQDDRALYGNKLPSSYCCIDSALNHRSAPCFMSLIRFLSIQLGVSLNEI